MLKLFKVLQFIFIFSKYFNQFNFELNRILNGLECVVWKNELVKTHQGGTNGPANNLRRKGVCFHREPANVGKLRDNFFIIGQSRLGMIFRLS